MNAIIFLLQRNAEKIKAAKETEALKIIVPGVYINSYQVDNPFVDDYDTSGFMKSRMVGFDIPSPVKPILAMPRCVA